MNKVTYIIGAGFSAPLGLPVMSNFLIKSKDMYFEKPEKFKHFQEVFRLINQMAVCKNYFETDLFNIEEILSIIEMTNFIQNKKMKIAFIKYIVDVIERYTPKFKLGEILASNWYDFMFGEEENQVLYGNFICNILGSKFRSTNMDKIRRIHVESIPNRNIKYSIISFNYDLVFENYRQILNNIYVVDENICFEKNVYLSNWEKTHLSKLHGCVGQGNIIPPTWAKGKDKNISKIWKNAFEIIKNSNEIRILGYSLPVSDSYIKYFLKSAIIQATHLRNIDVIVLDKSGDVKKRYEDFVKFNRFAFFNVDILEYFKELNNVHKKAIDDNRQKYYQGTFDFELNHLEQAHANFTRR